MATTTCEILSGLWVFCMTLGYTVVVLRHYFVTIRQPCRLQLIQYIMSVPNISRLIVISFVRKSKPVSFALTVPTSHQLGDIFTKSLGKAQHDYYVVFLVFLACINHEGGAICFKLAVKFAVPIPFSCFELAVNIHTKLEGGVLIVLDYAFT